MTTRLLIAARAVSIAVALLLAPAVLARPSFGRAPPPKRHWVPEFDPAAGGALVALLAGGALFVASRRKSK